MEVCDQLAMGFFQDLLGFIKPPYPPLVQYVHDKFFSFRKMSSRASVNIICVPIVSILLNQDLNYDESLSGRPGAWLVKKNIFICMQSQNFKKDLILKFKTISKTCFIFMIALTVYE